MFSFFSKKKTRPGDEAHFAITQGQVMALYIAIGTIIDRLPKQERDDLIGLLKHAVGQGFGGKGPFLIEELRPLYNNAMSAMIQSLIEGSSAPDLSNVTDAHSVEISN